MSNILIVFDDGKTKTEQKKEGIISFKTQLVNIFGDVSIKEIETGIYKYEHKWNKCPNKVSFVAVISNKETDIDELVKKYK